MRVLGILLIVLSALALAYQGVTYTKQEKVIDLGPIKATAEHQETIPIPPWVGGVGLAAGVVMLVAGGGRRRR